LLQLAEARLTPAEAQARLQHAAAGLACLPLGLHLAALDPVRSMLYMRERDAAALRRLLADLPSPEADAEACSGVQPQHRCQLDCDAASRGLALQATTRATTHQGTRCTPKV
jgi:hypothetical protein